MKYNEKIVALRKANGFTQEGFARAVGVTRQAVYKWEVGDSYPEAEKLIAIKGLFGISIDDLLDDRFDVIVEKAKKRTRKQMEVAPAVEEVAPAAEEVAPVAEEVAPAAEEVAPVAEEVAPAAEEVAPVAEEVTPAVEEVAPVAEEVAPAAEEDEFGFSVTENRGAAGQGSLLDMFIKKK